MLHSEPLTQEFVTEISGINLREPLDDATIKEIVKALDKYGVIIFRDQLLSQDEHVAFIQQFGPTVTSLDELKVQDRLGYAALTDISNVDAETGEVAGRTHSQTLMNIGNSMWHSDGSFMHRPFRYSVLAASSVVSWGGQTQFADIRSAFDALDERTKELLKDKIAEFYIYNVYEQMGIAAHDGGAEKYPAVRWPVIRTHPGSGRKVLWIDTKVRKIIGMSVAEGKQLIDELVEHIGQRERVYGHTWQVGDVVMYDNRSVLHRGRRFDLSERREMRRGGTIDDVSSLEVPSTAS